MGSDRSSLRVLLVEDSPRLRASLESALRNTGYAVEAAADGSTGLHLAQTTTFDVIVLDLMLPGLDGMQVLDRLRKQGRDTPVLCLTARDGLDDRVKGLHAGADDYVTKPFELRELLARIHALCRRHHQQYADQVTVADLVLDRAAKTVARGGTPVDLQAREFALLERLMRKAGQVVSRRELEEHLYGELDRPESNAIDSAICVLRRKISPDRNAAPLIHTRRGLGYVISAEPP